MKLTEEQFSDLENAFAQFCEGLESFKDICQSIMTDHEYNQFKYNILGHIEPLVSENHEWMTMSSDTMNAIVEQAENEYDREDYIDEDDDHIDDEDE